MEIYAPIAHRLGMQRIKWELEDLSLLYLDPIGYKEITDALAERKEIYDGFMERIQAKITERLKAAGIGCAVYGRIKHIYSIYRKMYSQNKELSEVLDLCAFRVIVNTIPDCYNVLGQVHDLFKPIPGHFKDYIGTPKPNLYQSLHTTVIGTEGIPFEVQIRTWEMHHTAEYGIAAHWKYKQGISGRTNDEEKFAWIRSLLEAQQDTDANEFVHDLKIDMFADEVFVFTPQGDVINLPAGATPIDFAYSIHSAIGNHMVGAKVNGRMIPFDHVLQNGDIVEIITSQSSRGPNRDWMKLAKSSEARGKIKQWLKRERRDENIIQGREMFEAEMRHAGLPMSAIASDEVRQLILKKLSIASLDDMYAAIGFGGMTATRCVNRIKDELMRSDKMNRPAADKLPLTLETRPKRAVRGIVVSGIDNCLVKFSRCCLPVPGDEIVGFVTRGYGVSVHRADCANYLKSKDDPESSGRWLPVSWAEDTSGENYETSLVITARDRPGLVLDIATVVSGLKLRISSLSARSLKDGSAVTFVSLELQSAAQLRDAMRRLFAISGVSDVKRSGTQA